MKVICPVCKKNETETYPGPPWDPAPRPILCAACENAAEAEADRLRLAENVEAATRAGRFDLI